MRCGSREGIFEGFKIEAKEINDSNRLEADLTEHDRESMKRAFELGLELNPGEEEIINHGDPDLREDGVF